MVENYKERFQIYEGSYVEEIIFEQDKIDVFTANHKISANKVILCTNGYTNFDIYDRSKDTVITKLKDNIGGVVGTMAAYINNSSEKFSSALYNAAPEEATNPYYYISQHPFILKNARKSLTTIGGPEKELTWEDLYDPKIEYVPGAKEKFDKFIEENYYQQHTGFDYQWQGLMGYTSNMLRWIGPDPEYPNLLYNLGCNGIGILPSIYGAYKVSRIIEGNSFVESIFDPL
jgi:glycine/D-amino acid oxidase-like deaminating enzyme